MIRLLIRTAIWLGSAAVGLLVAKLVLDDMSIDLGSFLFVVVVFAALQAILSPFMAKVAVRNAPALLGGAGLITTFVALVVVDAISAGMSISGVDTWLLATLIVWIVTMLASWLLPLLLAKRMVGEARDRRSG
jgi:hypothetical protein